MENSLNIPAPSQSLNKDPRGFISAELRLTSSLCSWVGKDSSSQLKMVLHQYLDLMERHMANMEGLFENGGIKAFGLSNRLMMAHIAKADENLARCKDVSLRETCLLAALRSISNFKVTGYGMAAALANALGIEKAEVLFDEARLNEKRIGERLFYMA